jgi:hypothetical protein
MIGAEIRLGVFLAIGCNAAWLTSLACPCRAQQQKSPPRFAEHKFLERNVQIHARQVSLANVIENLATSAKASIITDGVPERSAMNLEVDGTVREALDQIAAGFDCDWSVSKSGIIMISRHFADPTEHPQIHLKEMQQMVRDIIAAFQLVPAEVYTANFNVLLNQIARSLTPAQTSALESGTLTGADLNEPQLAWLNLAIQNYTFAFANRQRYLTPTLMDGMPLSFLQLKAVAGPDKAFDPTSPFANSARFPSFDYLYVVRGKDGRLVPYLMPKWQVN